MTDYEKMRDDVGKAIMCDADGGLGDRRGYRQTWDMLDDDIRQEIIEAVGQIAMALILAAMQEPTEEMQSAVRLVNRKHEWPMEMRKSSTPMWN